MTGRAFSPVMANRLATVRMWLARVTAGRWLDHEVGDRLAAQGRVGGLVDVDAAAQQLAGVDGVARDQVADPGASTMASISGRMIVYSPVSSNMMTTAVIGARAAPAKTAPIPTRA